VITGTADSGDGGVYGTSSSDDGVVRFHASAPMRVFIIYYSPLSPAIRRVIIMGVMMMSTKNKMKMMMIWRRRQIQ